MRLLLILILLTSCSQQMYRVEWTTPSGFEHHGSWQRDSVFIKDWVDYCNEKYPEIPHKVGIKNRE